MSLILQSRRVLCSEGIFPGILEIDDNRILSVQRNTQVDDPDEDFGDLLLMPGLIDTHVHVNEPGRTEWEGYASATAAAALGGVTLIADMPLNSIPVTTTRAAFEQKLAAARGQLWVDVAFWGGVIPGNEAELRPMVKAGVSGFKCFLCPSGIDEFPAATEMDLRRAMPILRDLGVPLLVHAELELPLREANSGDPRDYSTYLHSRPPEWEDAAVHLIIDLVRETGCRAHIVHLSSQGAIPALRRAKREGLPITAETCPHYLCLTAEEVPSGNTTYKCAPPIRGRANQDALWSALAEGVIDFVVTDHSPCIAGLKLPEEGDFLRAWGGISSLQLGLAAVFTQAERRGYSISQLSHWMRQAPASLLGFQTTGLQAGARADVIAFDTDSEFVVDPLRLAHKNPVTAYEGHALRGRVCHVWRGGKRIVAHGALTGTPTGTPWLSTSQHR